MSSQKSERLMLSDLDGNLIGMIVHYQPYNHYGGRELGYQIFSDRDRGKGYASEAVALLVNYLFATSTVNRLQARTDAENVASIRVISKLGFKKEGVLRQSMFVNGRYIDADLYALLRSEWRR